MRVVGQSPCVATLNTVTAFNQTSKDAFNFSYNLGNGSATGFRLWASGALNFDSTHYLSVDSTNGFVLGLASGSTTKAKISFVDASGKEVAVLISGLTSTTQNFLITRTLLASAGVTGFDVTKIANVIVTVDDTLTGSPTATGTINVTTSNIHFSPTATVTASAVTDLGTLQPVAGEMEPCAWWGRVLVLRRSIR